MVVSCHFTLKTIFHNFHLFHICQGSNTQKVPLTLILPSWTHHVSGIPFHGEYNYRYFFGDDICRKWKADQKGLVMKNLNTVTIVSKKALCTPLNTQTLSVFVSMLILNGQCTLEVTEINGL